MKKLSAAIIASAVAAALSVPVCAAAEDSDPQSIFARGVYAAWKDGKIVTYYVFTDEESGYTADARLGIRVDFVCEQLGERVIFRMADSDGSTVLNCDHDAYGNPVGTFGDTDDSYTFVWVENSDPDCFEIILRENGYFAFEDGVWKMTDAGQELASANSAAGGAVGLVITFPTSLIYGFDLTFVFTLEDGKLVKRSMAYEGSLENSLLYVNIHELLNDAYVDPRGVSSLSVEDNSGYGIGNVDLGIASAEMVTVKLRETDDDGSGAYDDSSEPVADLPDDDSADAPSDAPDEAFTEESYGAVEEILADAATDISEQLPVETEADTPDDRPADVIVDISDEASSEAPENTSDEYSGDVPAETPNEVAVDERGSDVVLKLPDGSVVVSLPAHDANPITGADDMPTLAALAAGTVALFTAKKRRQ